MGESCCLQGQVAAEQIRLANTRVQPDCALALEANQISQQQMSTASSLADILRRPHIHYRFVALVACTLDMLRALAYVSCLRRCACMSAVL